MRREQKPGPTDAPQAPAEDDDFARAMSGVVPLAPDPRERVRVPPPAHSARSTGANSTSQDVDAPPTPALRSRTPDATDTADRQSSVPATDDDAFARAMADVTPLGPDRRELVRVLPPAHTGRSSAADPRFAGDAFARAMADVVPLAPDPRGRIRPTPTVAVPETTALSEQVEPDTASGFVRAGVDRRELRKLKRGEYAVDDRLDLHGMTAVEACLELERFVANSRHKRRRCICIVHGRGLHSKDQVAVLKTRVRESLTANPSVLAWTEAPSSDGGSGAVYVLLRR